MPDMTCLNCGGEMELLEKSTFTGRDMREYHCPKCGRTELVDRGSALWKTLSDAREPER